MNLQNEVNKVATALAQELTPTGRMEDSVLDVTEVRSDWTARAKRLHAHLLELMKTGQRPLIYNSTAPYSNSVTTDNGRIIIKYYWRPSVETSQACQPQRQIAEPEKTLDQKVADWIDEAKAAGYATAVLPSSVKDTKYLFIDGGDRPVVLDGCVMSGNQNKAFLAIQTGEDDQERLAQFCREADSVSYGVYINNETPLDSVVAGEFLHKELARIQQLITSTVDKGEYEGMVLFLYGQKEQHVVFAKAPGERARLITESHSVDLDIVMTETFSDLVSAVGRRFKPSLIVVGADYFVRSKTPPYDRTGEEMIRVFAVLPNGKVIASRNQVYVRGEEEIEWQSPETQIESETLPAFCWEDPFQFNE